MPSNQPNLQSGETGDLKLETRNQPGLPPCEESPGRQVPPGEERLDGRSPRVLSVSELNRVVKELLEETFYPFWIRGEIGNLTVHRSGHVYFTLKDAQSQLSAVWFRGAANARQLRLAEGTQAELYGRLSVYEPRGQYQLLVERLRPLGMGQLQQQFEERKRQLQAEGLFDPERKRPIPALPRRIGVVTSPEGAAIRDFLQIISRRFANVQIRIAPAAVQGERAAREIVAAIDALNRFGGCDVIVVTRGGGSLEDLWPFNEEIVARAVAASATPIISAVGHEVDVTICDFAADLRVPTPSAAAELVIARQEELLEKVRNLQRRQLQAARLRLGEWRRRLDRAAHSPVFREPVHLVRRQQQRVDELSLRLTRALENRRDAARARLERATARLRALNPTAVLDRGYAIVLDKASGHAVTDAATVPPGTRLEATLAKGRLTLLATGHSA